MSRTRKPAILAVTFALLASSVYVPTAEATEWMQAWSKLTEPVDALFHRKNPHAPRDNEIERLAREIDWLEHHLDTYGTVVAKQPDVWGEARLMRHRDEFERQMQTQLGEFAFKMNAAIRRSDQAFLSMAMALQAAAGDKTPPKLSEAQSELNIVQGLTSSPTQKSPDANQASVIFRSEPFEFTEQTKGFTFDETTVSLEPTLELDQRARYLNHLHELRRINEGDDTADSPGYSLNLVRLPVSILPGKRTRKGYGAEITITASLDPGSDLLPTTFRNLVVNDLVDQLAYPMTRIIDSENKIVAFYLDRLAQYHFEGDSDRYEWEEEESDASPTNDVKTTTPQNGKEPNGKETPRVPEGLLQMQQQFQHLQSGQQGLPERHRGDSTNGRDKPKDDPEPDETKAVRDLRDEVMLSVDDEISVSVPAAISRRARQAIPPSQVLAMYDLQLLAHVAADAKRQLEEHPVNKRVVHLMDVRSFLREELQAAYELLCTPEYVHLWMCAEPELAHAVRRRDSEAVGKIRDEFFLHTTGLEPDYRFWEGNTTVALAWAILVESAVLNQRLIQDMKDISAAKRSSIGPVDGLQFYHPHCGDAERRAFNEYVKCRWPIHVFALDPVTQEQNIADAFSRRRELQVAMALAFASGQLNAQAMMRFTRRLEWDMATIALNRTIVGFSHGDDTFGWRFFPRFQTPPIKGNIATFGETLFGGPTRDQDMRQRELETGMRECVAIVIMPSFVPYVRIDTRTNWFQITNPRQTEISMRQTMQLSRSIKNMEHLANCAADVCDYYRDGEVERLLRRVKQLDRELPLQTMLVQVPHENTVGGFEMFNRGITDLAPELIGWYGAPGINQRGITRLFLVGDGFSVHDTRVIAGGRRVDFRLLSRQVMEVDVPMGLQALDDPQRGRVVDFHLATPYGISSHLLVPVAPIGALMPESLRYLAWHPPEYRVTFTYDKTEDRPFFVADGDTTLDGGHLAILTPTTAKGLDGPTLDVTVRYRDADQDFLAGTVSGRELKFDNLLRRYLLKDGELQTFLDQVNGVVALHLKTRVANGDSVPPTFQVLLFGTISDKDKKESLTIPGYLTVYASKIEKLPAPEPAPATEDGQ